MSILLTQFEQRQAMMEASDKGDVERLTSLLSAGVDPNFLLGISPLHLAVRKGHLAATQFLLEHRANPDTQSSYFKQTALHEAVSPKLSEEHRLELIECLLSHKADPNQKNYDQQTPLEFASTNLPEKIAAAVAALFQDKLT